MPAKLTSVSAPTKSARVWGTAARAAFLAVGSASMLLSSVSCGDASGAPSPSTSSVLDLADAADPIGTTQLALAPAAPICAAANGCTACNVDVDVNHIVFVHGYSSDKGAFSKYYSWFIEQNTCAGYKTFRVSIGQKAKTEMKHTCQGRDAKGNPITYGCDEGPVEISCNADQYDASCIGQCSSTYGDGKCSGYDRTKNGRCGANGQCVTYSDDGAKKSLSVWSEDLASFFWNNGLTDLPDRSVVVVTHSTGAPAMASFMTRGYDNDARLAIPARKVKKVINIQAALGGACGVSALGGIDDATTDLNRMQDDKLNFDFRKATFDGAVPWSHFQSKGETGLFGDECEGMGWGSITTGDYCGGTSHDGVVNNWVDSTSFRHPNGAGSKAGAYPFNITVGAVESKFCHVSDDDHPSYRNELSTFRKRLGVSPRPLSEVKLVPRTLLRTTRSCATRQPVAPQQRIDLTSGYSNYTCASRYQEQCIDDGSFDNYYDESCI
jgi:hypothetical protein